MNRKMAKMLNEMRATKEDIRAFKKLPHAIKGYLRNFHDTNPKMVHFTFLDAMESLVFKK